MIGMNRYTGAPVADFEHLKQSVVEILMTPIGSRVMRRDYGSRLFEYMDRPGTEELRLDIIGTVAEALEKWEPRLEVDRVGVDMSEVAEGRVNLDLYGTYIPDGRRVELEGLVVGTAKPAATLVPTIFLTFDEAPTPENQPIFKVADETNAPQLFWLWPDGATRSEGLQSELALTQAGTYRIIGDTEKITEFHCIDSGLSSVDLRYLPNLEKLHVEGNHLQQLDLSNSPKLRYLNCRDNRLKSLNISGLTKLRYLRCWNNNLESLDVSKLVEIHAINAWNNNFPTPVVDQIIRDLFANRGLIQTGGGQRFGLAGTNAVASGTFTDPGPDYENTDPKEDYESMSPDEINEEITPLQMVWVLVHHYYWDNIIVNGAEA